VTRGSGWELLAAEAEPVMERVLKKHYITGGKILRAMVTRLGPGCRIARHKDAHPSFAVAHRIHVPLVTNPDVEFIVGPERVPPRAHYAFELNNLMFHQVTNHGNSTRIHFILTTLLPRPRSSEQVEPLAFAGGQQAPEAFHRRAAVVFVAIRNDPEGRAPLARIDTREEHPRGSLCDAFRQPCHAVIRGRHRLQHLRSLGFHDGTANELLRCLLDDRVDLSRKDGVFRYMSRGTGALLRPGNRWRFCTTEATEGVRCQDLLGRSRYGHTDRKAG